jgi:hypothetical protein
MTWDQLLISIASLVGTTAVTSFLTDHIQRQLDYRKLRAKLDNFAGLQAVVLFGDTKYRIQSIDRHGIVMQNELQTIFVPIKKALDNVIALPSDSYDTMATKSGINPYAPVELQMSQMMDELLAQRFSALLDRVKQDFTSDDSAADSQASEPNEVTVPKLKKPAPLNQAADQPHPNKRHHPSRPNPAIGR